MCFPTEHGIWHGDDLHLRYGLLKLKRYTVPVDKISALQIKQPTFSRIFRKYQARIVTVGVGDESSELSNLTMAVSKEEHLHQLGVLIPEFMGIKRGTVHMLKMAAVMPYMEDKEAEEIAKAVL